MASAQAKLGQFGFIPFNIGPGVSNDNKVNLDVNLDIVYLSYFFAVEATETYETIGLGFGWTPVNYRYAFQNSYWSFINFHLFWNIFAFVPSENISICRAMFGPFASINYGPNLKFENYNHILNYGIRYNLGHMFSPSGIYVLNIEGGIRTIDNKNNFYFNVGSDFLWVIAILFNLRLLP
jgi:hypothetical protein